MFRIIIPNLFESRVIFNSRKWMDRFFSNWWIVSGWMKLDKWIDNISAFISSILFLLTRLDPDESSRRYLLSVTWRFLRRLPWLLTLRLQRTSLPVYKAFNPPAGITQVRFGSSSAPFFLIIIPYLYGEHF